MRKYAKYTAVESLWMHSIPDHWEYNKLRSIFWQRKEKNYPIKTTEILSLSAKAGVQLYSEKEHGGGNKAKDDITKYNIAHNGDIIVNCMNVISGSVGLSKWYGAISPVYYALVTRNGAYNRFYYHYLFKIETFQKSLLTLGRGILMHESSTGKLNTIRMRVSMGDLNNEYLPVPPRDEQDQIVRYLDWKVSHINRLIHGYQRQIKLLEERRLTLVDNAVTKGLNPNAETKDSGVYWLGDIPNNWNIIRAKYLFKKEKREPLENDEIVTCFRDGEVTLRKNRRTTGFTESLQENGYQHVCKGDLVIHVMDAFAGAIGISDSDGKGTPVYHCCTPLRNDIYVPYYMHFLRMMAHVGYIQSLYRGIRERSTNFTFDVFSAQMLTMPPVEEQKAIVAYIDSQTKRINLLKDKISQQINFFEEYRTRLISDVVTGQVDVRGVEIPDYTPEEDNAMEEETNDTEDVTDSAD